LQFEIDENGEPVGGFESAEAVESPPAGRHVITLVGVGHVFDIGARLGERIARAGPGAVALELDRTRMAALLQREREGQTGKAGERPEGKNETGSVSAVEHGDERRQDSGLPPGTGSKKGNEKPETRRRPRDGRKKHAREQVPLRYRLLARFQESVAAQYDVEVGEEMVHALKAGKEAGADIYLIDMDARRMLDRIGREMPFGEKITALRMIVLAVLSGAFPRLLGRTSLEDELDRFSENYDSYMKMFAEHLPTVKRILIDERDRHMAKAILAISGKHGNVVAVVGDGHVEGMSRILGEMLKDREMECGKERTELEVVRLKDLRGRGAAHFD